MYPTLAFAGDRQIIDIQTKYNIKYFINDYTYVINKKVRLITHSQFCKMVVPLS